MPTATSWPPVPPISSSFLASLDMRMKVEPIDELNIERVTQLVNKSNQFNLTTRRYTLAQSREMAASPDWRTLTFSLRDSLGDNGLISVILLRKHDDALAIDTWVMSCRVLQRGVEQFARNELVELARAEGCARILRNLYADGQERRWSPTIMRRWASSRPARTAGRRSGACDIAGAVRPLPHFIQQEPVHE